MEISLYYIDLSKYTLKNIKEIAKNNTLEDIDLYYFKKKGCNKIWIDVNSINIIASSKIKKNKESISLTREFHNKVISMNPSKIDNSFYEKSDKVIKIFKFDLTADLEQAKNICKKYNLNYNILKHNKNLMLRKLWLSDTDEGIVYYENPGHESVVSTFFIKDLKKCKEWELNIPQNIKTEEIILDVDCILDKISRHGIKSLTQKELSFLDSQ